MKIVLKPQELSYKQMQLLIDHFNYSIADINSYDELTDIEKEIMSKEQFDALTIE